ncbi:hypothetical protein P154DRAFT_440526 [Amniculicola lignicola CBS 123094]|uniref:Large ribosomal subunit protein eL14 domain-containing protein n=1 Tax=Amniculicola lignicola CBS 123094 TaxID=1392246 RepID=A0A6A5WET9_9PLEO|nr:hypothetical protein P154DRAFT_440526 [Amniculicola lignicola CBS 123094]
MTLTPVRIRGKKRKPGTKSTLSIVVSPSPSSPASTKRLRPTSTRPPKRTKMASNILSAKPTLQDLPTELLEIIFLYSGNISLPRACPSLALKLSSPTICMELFLQTFFYTVDHKAHIRLRHRTVTSDPALQSSLLTCRFVTWPFFLKYVQQARTALLKLRGKAWESTGVMIPDVSNISEMWPHQINLVDYLSFAEGFRIPEKLLHGPWTEDKTSLLYVLVALNGEIDWEGSLAGETAVEGIREAIREGNQRAVAALAVLLGIKQRITTEMVRFAIVECGCDLGIVKHLLFNAQILHFENPQDTLNFHDPAIWAWADRQTGAQGELIKDWLRDADSLSLQFYMDPERWREMVPFPYSGRRFNANSTFNHINRGFLRRLYKNYGRKITGARGRPQSVEMGDADITTSQWRLVEVGRVVLFASGPYSGKLATIVEIIDHKRVLVDGPSKDAFVPRHSSPLAILSLTPIVIPKLPRAAGNGAVKSLWEEANVEETFNGSSWAKSRAQISKRRQLTDFERFKVMKLRKQARYEVQKTLSKVRASAS